MFPLWILIPIVLSALYWLFILGIRRDWKKSLHHRLLVGEIPPPFFSVITIARNESGNINRLIKSILSQEYPQDLFELIIVDDFSSDDTTEVIQQHGSDRIKLIRLQNITGLRSEEANKKRGLELAVNMAGGNWIAVTDADCEPGPGWLKTLSAYISDHTQFLAGPVEIVPGDSLIGRFQSLDWTGMMQFASVGIDRGTFLTCSAANMAFRSDTFRELGGYPEKKRTSSGDDIFLLERIHRLHPGGIGFVKDRKAVVRTLPADSISGLFQQRLRWAGKIFLLANRWTIQLVLLLFLVHLTLLVTALAGLFYLKFTLLFLLLLSIKALVDCQLIKTAKPVFHVRETGNLEFFLHSFFHTIYIPLVGIFSIIKKERKWKGRKTR